ncbi:MAG TPA: hypothetical protein VF490_01980 [Chryseosolibacter sp.]
MKHFVNFLALLALLWGCEAEKPRPLASGTEYFPLAKGQYQIYSVQEVHYLSGSEPRTLNYELMTVVADSFPSPDGQYIYVIHRSTRENDSMAWQALDTWSVRKEDSRVTVSEGNTPFVKMIFPVREGTRWDGNTFNTLGNDEYVLTSAGRPLEVNGMTFEKTATVEQERNGDLIVFRDERSEVYAFEVGLVKKEIIQFHYCTDDACLGQQVIDEGIEMKMEIKEYGNG